MESKWFSEWQFQQRCYDEAYGSIFWEAELVAHSSKFSVSKQIIKDVYKVRL